MALQEQRMSCMLKDKVSGKHSRQKEQQVQRIGGVKWNGRVVQYY